MPRKQPTTLEECNAELERTRKQLQQYGPVKIYAQNCLQAPAE